MANEGGAKTVALTSHTDAPLMKVCRHALISGAPELGFRLSVISSQLSLIVVLDAVYTAVTLAADSRASVGFDVISAVTRHHTS